MNNHKELEILNDLFGTYVDLELENFVLQTKLLSQGVTINGIKALTKTPKLINLFKNLGFNEKQIKYYTSYSLNYYGPNSLHEVRKPRVLFLHDDLWEVTITSPAELKVVSFFPGTYLFDTLKQGVGGIIPKMVKERTGKSIMDPSLKNLEFSLQIKLCTDHKEFSKTCRGQLLKQIDFSVSDAEVFKSLHPLNLFRSIINFRNDSKVDLIKERLKLWGRVAPFSLHSASPEQLTEFISQLPTQDFGIKSILLINKVVSNFQNTISNEILLTGEVGANIFEYRQIINFNKLLKSLLK